MNRLDGDLAAGSQLSQLQPHAAHQRRPLVPSAGAAFANIMVGSAGVTGDRVYVDDAVIDKVCGRCVALETVAPILLQPTGPTYGANNRAVLTDAKLVGRERAGMGYGAACSWSYSFQISDGYTSNITIKYTGALPAGFGEGKLVAVNGTLNADKSVTLQSIQVFLVRDRLTRWGCAASAAPCYTTSLQPRSRSLVSGLQLGLRELHAGSCLSFPRLCFRAAKSRQGRSHPGPACKQLSHLLRCSGDFLVQQNRLGHARAAGLAFVARDSLHNEGFRRLHRASPATSYDGPLVEMNAVRGQH